MRGLGPILGATGLAALFLACGIEVRLGSHDGSCDDGGVGEFELDPSFGHCGRVVLDVGQQENLTFGVQGLALDGQGRLLLAGAGGVTGAHDFAVLRLLPTGARDTMFGVDGVVELDVGSPFDQAEGVLSEPDGATIIVGSAREEGGPPRSIVARLLPSGSVDVSFGTGGFVVADVGGRAGVLNGVVRRSSDGALLAAGQGWATWPGPADLQVLGRTANGEPLASFGSAGLAVADFFGSDEFGGSLAFTARGEVLVPGTAWYGTSFDVAVARLTAAGQLDPTFGDQRGTPGRVSLDFAGGNDACRVIAPEADGSMLCAGFATVGGTSVSALVRLLSSGAPDPAFAGGGRATLTELGALSAVMRLADGRILVGGSTPTGRGDTALALQLLSPQGQPLAAPFSVDLSALDDTALAFREGPAGRILVQATANRGTGGGGGDFSVLRLRERPERRGVPSGCASAPLTPTVVGLLALLLAHRRGPQ